MPYSFSPVEASPSKILILGTMPSVLSLKQQQYYGNPQNQFWKILFTLWDQTLPDSYEERVAFLKRNHISLWDVLMHCDREGSIDANIKNPQPNDIPGFLSRHSEIHTLFFNSLNARKWFDQLIPNLANSKLKKVTLPSTSPARAMKFDDKLEQWRTVKQACEAIPL